MFTILTRLRSHEGSERIFVHFTVIIREMRNYFNIHTHTQMNIWVTRIEFYLHNCYLVKRNIYVWVCKFIIFHQAYRIKLEVFILFTVPGRYYLYIEEIIPSLVFYLPDQSKSDSHDDITTVIELLLLGEHSLIVYFALKIDIIQCHPFFINVHICRIPVVI